jgi:uncharacterized spore protein YtfJ
MGSALNNNLNVLFEKIEGFVSSKTVVGEPVSIGGTIIVPLVDVTFGVAAGASEGKPDEKANKEASLGGMGAKITPSAVLVIIDGSVQLVDVKNKESVNKLIDMVPGVLSKIDFGAIFKKKKKDEDKNETEIKEIKVTE